MPFENWFSDEGNDFAFNINFWFKLQFLCRNRKKKYILENNWILLVLFINIFFFIHFESNSVKNHWLQIWSEPTNSSWCRFNWLVLLTPENRAVHLKAYVHHSIVFTTLISFIAECEKITEILIYFHLSPPHSIFVPFQKNKNRYQSINQ